MWFATKMSCQYVMICLQASQNDMIKVHGVMQYPTSKCLFKSPIQEFAIVNGLTVS